MSAQTMTTVHHLYCRPGDLLPACGVTPGPDRSPSVTDWHTGHNAEVLRRYAIEGSACCWLCLEMTGDMA